jgi:hypothetical protein
MTNLINKAVEVKKEVSIKNDTSSKTWAMVQEVAHGEIKANGKMLYIFKNFMKMYEDNQLDISKYFDEKANDKSLKSILFDISGERKTLIAKDFSTFNNKVLIPSLNQNLLNFQKDFSYEYKALEQISPVVLFGLANRKWLDLDKMLIETENVKIPVEICLDWNIFNFKSLSGSEQTFRHNLVKSLFSDKEQGKQYYCTFRGDKGILEIAKKFFMPKKVHSDNVVNAEVSPFAKAMQSLTDTDKGVIGAITTLTQAKEGTPAIKRLNNEIDELYSVIIKSLELIANSNTKNAQQTLLDIHADVLMHINADNFNSQFPKVKLHKVEFNPRVKNTVIDLNNGGDVIKFVSNL